MTETKQQNNRWQRPDWIEYLWGYIPNFAGIPTGTSHDIGHFLNVERNGLYLARHTSGASQEVISLFALLHDSQRHTGPEKEHGIRADIFARNLRDLGYLDAMQTQDFENLSFALRWHSDPILTREPTIGACLDADRLELSRYWMAPSPEMMNTEAGKAIAMQFYPDQIHAGDFLK
ncbi:MAG: hypothetical protein JW892_17500 [Anaerolineae bacterium]|nr:hypothetical protein [Anaerolineae bacterium]